MSDSRQDSVPPDNDNRVPAHEYINDGNLDGDELEEPDTGGGGGGDGQINEDDEQPEDLYQVKKELPPTNDQNATTPISSPTQVAGADSGDLDVATDANHDLNTDPEKPNQLKSEQQLPTTEYSNVWTLPADKDVCTLEEIRRGQVINKVAPNECPVLGCGKKINELRAEPSPGTIASGLRTHVLFVHYASIFRKVAKKRKLGWSNKRRSQPSPRKQFIINQQLAARSSPTNSDLDFDAEPENCAVSSFVPSGLNLIQKSISPQSRPSPGSLINRKVKQLAANKSLQPSSLQSLIQATGGGALAATSGGARLEPQANKQKNQQDSNAAQKNFNQTTSSLFSILAGLTQQPQQQQQLQQQNQNPRPQTGGQQQSSVSRTIKTAHGANTINISQCSRNTSNNSNNNNNNNNINPPVNSSLLTLLNEKISGNVASSLQSQLKKSLLDSNQIKVPTTSTPNSRQNVSSPANHSYYQANMCNNLDTSVNYNNGSSILNSLCAGNGDSRLLNYDGSLPLNSFIELIAIKTGSNIGPAGVAEAKKIIEKFTTSLICNSQTIADHYLAPFIGDVPQQKPEISPSDVMLAYKMMHKSHAQP